MSAPPGPLMRLRHEIDGERRRAVGRDHARVEGVRVGGVKLDRQHAVLQAVLAVDVGKAARHDAADADREHRPHRAFARGAAAEIAAGHQDAGLRNCGLLSTKSGSALPSARRRVRMNSSSRVVRLELRVACTGAIWSVLMSSASSGTATPVWRGERLHHAAPASICRTSTMRPAIAAAAAVAGLTRCVRTPGALAVLEIAVGGRDAALARLAAVAVAAGAHRAAGFAPEEAGVAEHAVEAGGLGLALHVRRARHHHARRRRPRPCGRAPPRRRLRDRAGGCWCRSR